MATKTASYVSEFAKPVERYCSDVVSGRIVTGKLVQLAVKRHLDDLKRARKPNAFPFHHDQKAAERAIRFIQCLKHSTGEFAGELFLLQPWQLFLVWVLFGWLQNKDDLRRFRWAFISLGRGNGKSPLAAAMLLFLCCADQPIEQRAQIKIAATERGTQDGGGAMIVFNECAQFIRGNETLSKRCRILAKNIVYLPTESVISPLGKEAKTKDGFNLHAFAADELHEWRAEHQPLWDKLETAMGKRRQPLGLVITTAGSDKSALWRQQYTDAQKVLKGVWEDPQQFVFIAQADDPEPENNDPGDDILGPTALETVFPKANPNLGVSVKADYLARMIEQARQNPLNRQKLQRYHANQLVRAAQKIIPMDLWELADEQELPDLTGAVCYGGLDLGWRDDLASFYLVFPRKKRRFSILGWSWTCETNPHRNLDAEPFRTWIRQGKLIVTQGDVNDHRAVLAKIRWASKRFRLGSVALDPNNARAMEVEMVNDLGLKVYAFGQSGKKYNEPLREFLDALKGGRIDIGGDPVLKFAASNMVVRTSHDQLMMPDKLNSDDKIDPIVATLMGYSECLYNERARKAGYMDRGLRKIGQ